MEILLKVGHLSPTLDSQECKTYQTLKNRHSNIKHSFRLDKLFKLNCRVPDFTVRNVQDSYTPMCLN